ncbi:hypothetical protein [Lacinutrix neustonica]|uniref:hypothetical protein n=1 Tax=Lacinutrix neustonica TaxID=2980107 RepID=UPI0028BE8AF8|nr:hypothetical protein [Lacinutrix neustonica]
MKTLVYIFISLGIFATYAQTDYNTKNGYAAEGYDVVSYFENKAEEGKKNIPRRTMV